MVCLQLVEISYTVKRNMQVGSIEGVRGRALISYHMLELKFGSAGSEEGRVQQISTDDDQWRSVPWFSSFLTFPPALWNSLACFHYIVCFDTSVVPVPEHKAIPCFNVLSSKNVFCNLHFLLWAELCFLSFDQAEADWPHPTAKKKKKKIKQGFRYTNRVDILTVLWLYFNVLVRCHQLEF